MLNEPRSVQVDCTPREGRALNDLPPIQQEAFALTTSRNFTEWLTGAGVSLAFTTYQAGKLFLLGTRPDGRLAIFERTFPRSMGLGISPGGRSLFLATHFQLLRFDDVVDREHMQSGNDAIFAPHLAWITGDLDIHDVGVGGDGRPIF